MSASSHVPSENARKLMQALLRSIANVKNQTVAEAIDRDDATVSRIVSGESGVKLIALQPFLACLGFKVVPVGHICIDAAEWEATRILARKYIETQHETPSIQVDWNS